MSLQRYIITALVARGETLLDITFSAGSRKLTRTYSGQRDDSGNLVPLKQPSFWFVGKNGSVRFGHNVNSSMRLKPQLTVALITEGKAIEDGAKSS